MRAVRIVAERLQDCYAALGIVHTHYRHLPDEFDDYVANPKPNGYQSIHTVVLGPGGKTIEIQIRTRQMHEDAELGVAAHWKYKEGASAAASGGRGYEDRIAWLRKLIAWQEEMADSGEMLDEVRSQVFDDRVYVFTPKGDVVDLPSGSTPLDFAYHIHSDVGHRCIGAKISGRIVPFTYQLQMGDQIEIITQKQPNPSRDWLNPNLGYVTTSRGRSKIHAWFRKQYRDYFGDNNRLNMVLNFWLNKYFYVSLASQNARPLINAIKKTIVPPDACCFANWLRNHDELDLEGIGNKNKQTVLEAFAPDEKMNVYQRGIRRRLAPMLNGNRQRLAFCHAVLFSLPGVPIMRYGDEIGMGDDLALEERYAVRTPMQWALAIFFHISCPAGV